MNKLKLIARILWNLSKKLVAVLLCIVILVAVILVAGMIVSFISGAIGMVVSHFEGSFWAIETPITFVQLLSNSFVPWSTGFIYSSASLADETTLGIALVILLAVASLIVYLLVCLVIFIIKQIKIAILEEQRKVDRAYKYQYTGEINE